MKRRVAVVAAAMAMAFGITPAPAFAEIEDGSGTGARVGVLPGAFGLPQMAMGLLQGEPCAAPNVCDPIYYFNPGSFLGGDLGLQSLNDGEQKLDAWIRNTPGKKIAMGHSLGASVIYKWLRDHSNDPTAPPPSELSFITMGTPEHRGTGLVYSDPTGMYNYRKDLGYGIPADTPYKVVDVCRQWDGWCYWIPGDDRSKKGQNSLHLQYDSIDLDDPANQVDVEGNITYVLVPTPGW